MLESRVLLGALHKLYAGMGSLDGIDAFFQNKLLDRLASRQKEGAQDSTPLASASAPKDVPALGLKVYTGFGSAHKSVDRVAAQTMAEAAAAEKHARDLQNALDRQAAGASAGALLNAESEADKRSREGQSSDTRPPPTHTPPLTVYRQKKEDVEVILDKDRKGLAGETAADQARQAGVFLGAQSKSDLPLFRTIEVLSRIIGKGSLHVQ